MNPKEHLSVQEQRQNNDLIERCSVYNQSDRINPIAGLYQ